MKTIVLLSLMSFLISACGQLITPEAIVAEPVENTPTLTPQPNVTLIPTVTARPTSTPKPATPEPTPTPTMTPTPIIYAIQPGDTLLAVALAFGVPAEAIQTANGIVDPRRLQVGQVLIIPEPEEESTEPTPTPTPFPVIVQGVSFHDTPQGSLWSFGEVVNPGSDTLAEIVVEINLFDAEGKLLSSKAVFTELDLLVPNYSIPFAALFEEPPSSFAQYQVSVISAVPILGDHRYYLDITPIETSATLINESTYRISGQLENVGEENVEAIQLVAVAYNTANQVVAERQATLDVILLRSKARTPFEIDLTLPDVVVDRYVVQAQGLRVP